MTSLQIDPRAERVRKARWAARFGKTKDEALMVLTVVFLLLAVALFFLRVPRMPWLAVAAGLISFMPAAWYRYDLSKLPPGGDDLTGQLAAEALVLMPIGKSLQPQSVWASIRMHWQALFILNRLYLDGSLLTGLMSAHESDMEAVWRRARQLAVDGDSPAIEVGHLTTALLLSSPDIMEEYLPRLRLDDHDVMSVIGWLDRALDMMRAEKPYFGGIGRDWANGFTPHLNQFGHNISLDIEQSGAHYGHLTESPGVQGIRNAFSQGASAVALIGDTGVGKTSNVAALAQLLLEEKNDRNLEHRQIVALNAATIVSSAIHQGELEQIVTMLLVETAHAGHIILFFDDAQLFFSDGHGAVDLTQILLPVVQSRTIQMVLAMTPHDYQALKVTNPAFAALLTPVVLTEPPENDVIQIVEDAALYLEANHKVLITYEAIREAYTLSGRYADDLAYPGKAIRLLEQSLSYAENGKVVTPGSVQKTVEQAHGVKVGAAAPAETDVLLNLEDRIHERMINQTTAVNAVAAALRRARAGVANPKRPIGSFLFLGPTGVGKTELAKAVAATYFGSEASMVRLDMSEYQQLDDVQRLLSNGANETKSLILSVRQNPFTVVLLDEIEKAHPSVLNLLLQLLDEGQLTDAAGRSVSFKDCVVIATSNAGADLIRERISSGADITAIQPELTDNLISSGHFKPELLNRFDEIVFFRPLSKEELSQVVHLMLRDINQTLAAQKISVELTDAAVAHVVAAGYDPRLGARPMRRALQRFVEDSIAGRILRGEARPGDHIVLDATDFS